MCCPENDAQLSGDTSSDHGIDDRTVTPAPPKKGRLWPAIVFLAVMLIVGTVVFILTKEPPPQTPWFTVEDGVLYFDETLYYGNGELQIPATVDGQTVTAISEGCFRDHYYLTSVTLPDTLRSIGDDAFNGCEGLTDIKFPESLEHIGARAFSDCRALEAIYVSASVQSIDEDAFLRCSALMYVFYAGQATEWDALYPQPITRNTHIYTVSGPDADHYN